MRFIANGGHMKLSVIVSALAVLILSGCGWNTRQPPTTAADRTGPNAAQGEIRQREDLTTGRIVFYGPPQDIGGGEVRKSWRLRSEIDRDTGKVRHWLDLRIRWSGSGIDYWTSAVAVHGKDTIPLVLGPSELAVGTCARVMWIGCDHDEEVSAQLPEDLLAVAREDSLSVRFSMQHHRSYGASLDRRVVAGHLDHLKAWWDARGR